MKRSILLAVIALISGCANHPMDCAIGIIAWDDCLPGTKGYEVRQRSLKNLEAARAEKAVSDDLACRSYGATPGSDAYVNCRVQRDK